MIILPSSIDAIFTLFTNTAHFTNTLITCWTWAFYIYLGLRWWRATMGWKVFNKEKLSSTRTFCCPRSATSGEGSLYLIYHSLTPITHMMNLSWSVAIWSGYIDKCPGWFHLRIIPTIWLLRVLSNKTWMSYYFLLSIWFAFQRDSWMTDAPDFFPCTSRAEIRKQIEKEKEEERAKLIEQVGVMFCDY